jgi:hypothetical protein
MMVQLLLVTLPGLAWSGLDGPLHVQELHDSLALCVLADLLHVILDLLALGRGGAHENGIGLVLKDLLPACHGTQQPASQTSFIPQAVASRNTSQA